MGRYSDSGVAVGVSIGSQLSFDQSAYERAVSAIERQIADDENDLLISELEANNVKFNKDEIVFITRDPTGQVVWLETGNEHAGLNHIKKRHAKDFESKFGISEEKIPSLIREVVQNGTLISNTNPLRNGKPTIQRVYEYRGEKYLLIALGTNGFIVTAYPIKKPRGV